MAVTITAKALGLPENVRMVNAPLRQRLGLRTICGREVIDTRSQRVGVSMDGMRRVDALGARTIPFNASLGVWYFFKGGTRFHEGYEDIAALIGANKGEDKWVESVFEQTAAMQKELGFPISLQCHYPNELGPQNVGTWVKMMQQTGIGVDSIVPFLFGGKEFAHSSLTNRNKDIREMARQRQLETFQMADLLGLPDVNHWFGIDGVENPFGVSYSWAFDQIEGSTADSMDAVPGQQSSEEPKPYEPRGLNYMASTHDGLYIARNIEARLKNPLNIALMKEGIRMVGMCPEIGHMQMAYEVLAKMFELCMRENRLFCIHWNGQPLGNYDIDENPGAFNYEAMDEIAYVLQRGGYAGPHTLDINPLRMKLANAVQIGFMNIQAALEQASDQPHEMIMRAVADPDHEGNAVIQNLLLSQRRAGRVQGEQATAIAERLAAGLRPLETEGIIVTDDEKGPSSMGLTANQL